MASMASPPILFITSGEKRCLLCDLEVTASEKSRTVKKGLSTIDKLANRWCLLDERVCLTSPYKEFKEVKDRLEGVDKKIGAEVHESCGTTFRSRIKRKEEASNQLPPREREPEPEPEPSPVENPLQSPRLIRGKRVEKMICFVCNSNKNVELPYKDGGIARCETDSAMFRLSGSKDNWLKNPDSLYFEAAQRFDVLTAVRDVYAADVYYHKKCYNKFIRMSSNSVIVEDSDVSETNEKVVQHFYRKILQKVIRDKNAYLLSELLRDCKEISKEFGLDEAPVYLRHTYRVKESLMQHFETQISFSSITKYVVVHSSEVNVVTYSFATLKGRGLQEDDIVKSFANLIR